MTQLSLWDSANDDRPLPERIADGGNDWLAFSLSFHDIDNVRYYAVQDWVKGVALTTTAKAASNLWTAMKKRLDKAEIEFPTPCRKLSYKATDGKTYQMDHADAETLYLITQRMDAETGIRTKVLNYLAKAGVLVDEMRIEPGKALEAGIEGYANKGQSAQWIEMRALSKISRQAFTSALRDALIQPQPQYYAKATNAVYVGLWARTADQLRAELGLPKKANLRDYFHHIALAYNSISESIIAQELGVNHDLTWIQAEHIIKSVAALIKPQIDAVGRRLRIDLATGKPLLSNE